MATQTRRRGAAAEAGNGSAAAEREAPVTFHREVAEAPTGTLSEAAEVAARQYAPEEVEEQAEVIRGYVEARLQARTEQYLERAYELARRRPEIEAAEPIGPVFPLYPYWNLLLYGPFQPLGGAGGPFLPHKIIRVGEPAFVIATLWRNPACMNWACPAPSAATLMSPYEMRMRLDLMNFTTVQNVPGPPPVNFAPLGFGNLNSAAIFLARSRRRRRGSPTSTRPSSPPTRPGPGSWAQCCRSPATPPGSSTLTPTRRSSRRRCRPSASRRSWGSCHPSGSSTSRPASWSTAEPTAMPARPGRAQGRARRAGMTMGDADGAP